MESRKELDIGTKIKAARMAAHLTGEQAAEALGVSRQTVSNWERGKTYPDIVSVVRMSELYHISLDDLLKGGKAAPDYLQFLADSTDTVKSRSRQTAALALGGYLAVWALALRAFWFGQLDAMGFSILYLWLLLPAAAFAVSLLFGAMDLFGRNRWWLPAGFALLYLLADFATFGVANMIAFSKLNTPNWELLVPGALFSLLGLAVGAGGRRTARWAANRRAAYRFVTLRQRPWLKKRAAAWFSEKWGVPQQAYLDCMADYLAGKTEYGWYLCLQGGRIVGGLGVIQNDFHNRPDLAPNICAVFTEPPHRGRGIAGTLLGMAVEQLRAQGISPVYLLTDRTGFYERYGWEFFCMVQGDGEPQQSRMYIHR